MNPKVEPAGAPSARAQRRAETITVELFRPSGAKQSVFSAMQSEFVSLVGGFAGRRHLPEELDLRHLVPSPWRSAVARLVARYCASKPILHGGTLGIPFGPSSWQLLRDGEHIKLSIPVWHPGQTLGAPVVWQLPVRVPSARLDRLERLIQAGIPTHGQLFQRDGQWFFRATFLNGAPVPRTPRVIGVDEGERILAFAVEPASNRRLVVSGRAYAHRQRHLTRIANRLEAAGDRRAARRVRAKAQRHRDATRRQVANTLVGFARQFPEAVLAFEAEDPNDCSGGMPRLRHLASRKAEPAGIPVLAVDPRGSSQRCHRCGKEDPGQRRGSRYRCACGYQAHADLNAARNLAQTALRHPRSAAGGYNPAGQAARTAGSPIRPPRKGRGRMGGRIPLGGVHAPIDLRKSLVSHRNQMEVQQMASLVKDLTDTSQQFVTGTLDNLKGYGDRLNEELKNANLLDVSKRVFDVAIDNTKQVVKVAAEGTALDPFAKVRAVADSSLEAAREVVNTLHEEGKRADLFGLSTRLTLEGLNTLRSQIDLGIDTTKTVTNRLMPMSTGGKPTVGRPPQVTRVEIEHEKPGKGAKQQPQA